MFDEDSLNPYNSKKQKEVFATTISMKREVFIHGIYPRSKDLVKASRGFDRGSVSQTELTSQQETDKEELVALQEGLGFTFVEDGKLPWQDMFRPFAQTTSGLSSEGGLTRWFDTNTFYRKPVIAGPLTPDLQALDEFFPQVGSASSWKVTLPSPLTFARLSHDATTNHPQETLEKITQVLKLSIERLEQRGVSMIQLNEPYLPYHGVKADDMKDLIHALSLFTNPQRNAQLAIHFYFGDASPIIRRLEEADHGVHTVGVDFLRTRIHDLPSALSHNLIAGVVDGQTSLLKTPDELNPFIDGVESHTRPNVLYLTNNTDLEYMPESIARQKVHTLAQLKK